MERKRLIVVGTIVVALVGVGGWLTADRPFPVPSSLIGEWENATPIMAAGPGEVRLTIHRDGSAVATFDRERYVWFGGDKFHLRVRGNEAVVRADPDGEPVTMRIEIEADRFRIYDPATPDSEQDAFVFRRPARE